VAAGDGTRHDAVDQLAARTGANGGQFSSAPSGLADDIGMADFPEKKDCPEPVAGQWT